MILRSVEVLAGETLHRSKQWGQPTNSAKPNIYSIPVTQTKSETREMGHRGTKQDWISRFLGVSTVLWKPRDSAMIFNCLTTFNIAGSGVRLSGI